MLAGTGLSRSAAILRVGCADPLFMWRLTSDVNEFGTRVDAQGSIARGFEKFTVDYKGRRPGNLQKAGAKACRAPGHAPRLGTVERRQYPAPDMPDRVWQRRRPDGACSASPKGSRAEHQGIQGRGQKQKSV